MNTARLALLVGVFMPISASASHAATARTGQSVVVGPEEVIDDDLYALGWTIEIQGRVNGDVLAFGNRVIVGGTVTGDLVGGGGRTTITGTVGGSVRRCGSGLVVKGEVGEDVMAAVLEVSFAPGAQVGRDVLLVAADGKLAGTIARHLDVAAGALDIAGRVQGDTDVEASALRLFDSAHLGGDLRYEGDAELQRDPGAIVGGTVTHETPPSSGATAATSLLRELVGWLGLGLVFVSLSRGFGRRTLEAITGAPWRSLGRGLLALVAVPAIGFVAFAVSLEIGGWWLMILAPALFALGLALGFVVSAEFAGASILALLGRSDTPRAWALVLGLILLVFASRVPYVGLPVAFVAVVLGLGALAGEVVRTQRANAVA